MADDDLVPADQALLAAGKEVYGFEKVLPGVPLYFINVEWVEVVTVRDSIRAGRTVAVQQHGGAYLLGYDLTADPEHAAFLARQRQAERIARALEQVRRAEAFDLSIPELPPVSGAAA